MRAVVTGGAGFIGSHLIEALVSRGVDVVCVERAGAAARTLEGLPITWVRSGLEDADALRRAVKGAAVVFHLAGVTEARRARDFYLTNTEGTERVVRAAAAQGERAPRVVLLSSLAALGPCRDGERLSEQSVPFPLSHYGRSKLLAEAVLHAHDRCVPATILRLSPVYGPRERAVLKFFRLVRRGFALTVGAWEREVSLIYIADVVAALLACAQNEAAVGRTYCVAHPQVVTWRDFAWHTGVALECEPVLVSVPRGIARFMALGAEVAARAHGQAAVLNRERVRELSQRRWVCDTSRVAAELSFRPEWSLPRGIAETVECYRRERCL